MRRGERLEGLRREQCGVTGLGNGQRKRKRRREKEYGPQEVKERTAKDAKEYLREGSREAKAPNEVKAASKECAGAAIRRAIDNPSAQTRVRMAWRRSMMVQAALISTQ